MSGGKNGAERVDCYEDLHLGPSFPTDTNQLVVALGTRYKMGNSKTFGIKQGNVLITWRERLPK